MITFLITFRYLWRENVDFTRLQHFTKKFLAPSFGCNIEPYRSAFGHAVEKLQALGYRQVFGPNCYAGEGVGISNTPEK